VLAIFLGSFLGTILAGVIRGYNVAHMFTERLWGASMTMGLGIGVGCVVVAAAILRERKARDEARLHRAKPSASSSRRTSSRRGLQLMQAQVEPHFLFNTLANVQHLVETDPPQASKMLESLIQYLRAALPQMRESATNLGREVDMARAFLEIHRIRMGTRLEWTVDVPSHLRCAPFPPMMLISLVENALKHGVDPRCECSSVAVRAGERDGKLFVAVATPARGSSPSRAAASGSPTFASA
jgi:LytS/YehU family sensor histidine kinase